MKLYDIEIPPRFADDHANRALPTGTFLRFAARGRYVYRCTVDELCEWQSDARLYEDCAGTGWDIGDGAAGLQSSARATLKRVTALLDRIPEREFRLGIRLYTERKRRRLTQTDVAKEIGVTRNTIARWERLEMAFSRTSRRVVAAWIQDSIRTDPAPVEVVCTWAEGNKFIGDCEGPVTHVCTSYRADRKPIFACTHHAKASVQVSPMAGYAWRPITKEKVTR